MPKSSGKFRTSRTKYEASSGQQAAEERLPTNVASFVDLDPFRTSSLIWIRFEQHTASSGSVWWNNNAATQETNKKDT
jgi:hypothetical protein